MESLPRVYNYLSSPSDFEKWNQNFYPTTGKKKFNHATFECQ